MPKPNPDTLRSAARVAAILLLTPQLVYALIWGVAVPLIRFGFWNGRVGERDFAPVIENIQVYLLPFGYAYIGLTGVALAMLLKRRRAALYTYGAAVFCHAAIWTHFVLNPYYQGEISSWIFLSEAIALLLIFYARPVRHRGV